MRVSRRYLVLLSIIIIKGTGVMECYDFIIKAPKAPSVFED